MEEGGVNPWTRHQQQQPPLEIQQTEDAFSFNASSAYDYEGERGRGGHHGAEEEDICRVCRGEATPDMPLMHPWYVSHKEYG